MLPKMVDMAKTPEEMVKDAGSYPMSIGSQSKYPYGLSIRFCQETLDKLGLDGDCEVGDFIHVFGLAKVTSVSKNDTGEGEKCDVELQFTHLGVEDEDEENEKEEGDDGEEENLNHKYSNQKETVKKFYNEE